MTGKLTKQDIVVLAALVKAGGPETPGRLASNAALRTSSPRETAARHLIKLTKMGLAFKSGTAMFPKWEATFEGRAALTRGEP